MKAEEQRIAIAEACGWKSKDYPDPITSTNDLPHYLNDLNAMHEAEKVLIKDGKGWEYLSHLYKACGADVCESPENAIHATATQRAEAFLRVLGLWEE